MKKLKNMNENLKKRLKNLSIQAYKAQDPQTYLTIINNLLTETINENPKDSESRLYRALIKFNFSWDAIDLVIADLEKIFEYDPYNPRANLVIAFIQYAFFSEVSKEIFDKLCQITNDNNQIMAMIEIAKAWHLQDFDQILCEKSLQKSIEYAPNFVANYVLLGQFYFNQNNFTKSKELLKKGLNNIKGCHLEINRSRQLMDIEEFFNEAYTNIYVTQSTLESIQRWLKNSHSSTIV